MVVFNSTYIDHNGEKDNEWSVDPVSAGTFEIIKNGILGGVPVTVFEICNIKWISTELNVEDSYFASYIAYEVCYNPATSEFPESITIMTNDTYNLFADDRILTQQQFEQEMAGDGE